MTEAPTDKLAEIREQAIANRRASRRMDPAEAQLRLDVFREYVIAHWVDDSKLSDVSEDARTIADQVATEARRLKLLPE